MVGIKSQGGEAVFEMSPKRGSLIWGQRYTSEDQPLYFFSNDGREPSERNCKRRKNIRV